MKTAGRLVNSPTIGDAPRAPGPDTPPLISRAAYCYCIARNRRWKEEERHRGLEFRVVCSAGSGTDRYDGTRGRGYQSATNEDRNWELGRLSEFLVRS